MKKARHMPETPKLGRQWPDDQKFKVILSDFEASLCYMRTCLKTNKQITTSHLRKTHHQKTKTTPEYRQGIWLSW